MSSTKVGALSHYKLTTPEFGSPLLQEGLGMVASVRTRVWLLCSQWLKRTALLPTVRLGHPQWCQRENSLSHSVMQTQTHSGSYSKAYRVPRCKDKPLNSMASSAKYPRSAGACVCMFTSGGSWEAGAQARACICVSACIGSRASQKQHITWLSLHPEEGPFHLRMLLTQLRWIFLDGKNIHTKQKRSGDALF